MHKNGTQIVYVVDEWERGGEEEIEDICKYFVYLTVLKLIKNSSEMIFEHFLTICLITANC